MTTAVKLQLEMSDDEAHGLSQYLKRLGYDDVAKRTGGDETAPAWSALLLLQGALRDAGYSPR